MTKQAGESHVHAFHLLVQVFPVCLVKISELSGEFELRVQLTQRASCHMKKLGKFFLTFPGCTLSNVAGDAHNCPADLIRQPKTFLSRKPFGGAIHAKD